MDDITSLADFVDDDPRYRGNGCKVCQLAPATLEAIAEVRARKKPAPFRRIVVWLDEKKGIAISDTTLRKHFIACVR